MDYAEALSHTPQNFAPSDHVFIPMQETLLVPLHIGHTNSHHKGPNVQ